jgi:hypothetical protein
MYVSPLDTALELSSKKGSSRGPLISASLSWNIFVSTFVDFSGAILRHRRLCTLVYLLLLVLLTVILASDSLLETAFFLWPANIFLNRFWNDQLYIAPHPYFLHGTFFVLGVTLFLFFASGLYNEKITYANK